MSIINDVGGRFQREVKHHFGNTSISDRDIDFRNLETELVKKISAMDNIVVSCGGGTVMRQCNVDEMKKNGTIVLLTAEPETVYERVKGSHNRPLLEKNMNPEYIKELMEARRPKYEAAADFVIKTDNRTAEEICLEINKRLKTVDN